MNEVIIEEPVDARPPFWISLIISVILVGLVSWFRLEVVDDMILPMGSGLLLLLCLWNRSLRLLYGIAVTCTLVMAVKVMWVVPDLASAQKWEALLAHSVETWAFAGLVHALLVGRERVRQHTALVAKLNSQLDERNTELTTRNWELEAQRAEILRQNEELQSQARELERRSEELREQAKVVQQQAQQLQDRKPS